MPDRIAVIDFETTGMSPAQGARPTEIGVAMIEGGRIVDIVAELDRDELCGATGARSVAALVAWKLGTSSANAHTITTIAGRLEQFPRCAQGMREGQLSLDQVGVIAARAAEGSDEHYAQLAAVATVNQLRTAVKLEPRPDPDPRPEPARSITTTATEVSTSWRITLPHEEAALFDAVRFWLDRTTRLSGSKLSDRLSIRLGSSAAETWTRARPWPRISPSTQSPLYS